MGDVLASELLFCNGLLFYGAFLCLNFIDLHCYEISTLMMIMEMYFSPWDHYSMCDKLISTSLISFLRADAVQSYKRKLESGC